MALEPRDREKLRKVSSELASFRITGIRSFSKGGSADFPLPPSYLAPPSRAASPPNKVDPEQHQGLNSSHGLVSTNLSGHKITFNAKSTESTDRERPASRWTSLPEDKVVDRKGAFDRAPDAFLRFKSELDIHDRELHGLQQDQKRSTRDTNNQRAAAADARDRTKLERTLIPMTSRLEAHHGSNSSRSPEPRAAPKQGAALKVVSGVLWSAIIFAVCCLGIGVFSDWYIEMFMAKFATDRGGMKPWVKTYNSHIIRELSQLGLILEPTPEPNKWWSDAD